MDPIYPRFAAAHPVFYELPDGHSNKRSGDGIFEPVPTHLWREWRNVHNGPWSVWSPVDSELPEQGWKVHVSALHSNAELALAATSRFCHQAGIAFKFLRSAADLERALSKDADRAGAGKFITIYPPSQQDLLNTLDTLDRELGNNDAPYILSDLRWKRGPLFVRYGAFLPLIMSENGLDIPAIRDPRTNTLVADRREAAFFIPAWVQMPDFLQQQLDALGSTPPPGFPLVTGTLQHSNAGGIYTAEIDGETVVLKEARPHAGWTPDGRDAVTRLQDEECALRQAASRVRVPRVRGVYEAHGHRFLALERLAGRPLSELVAATNPLTLAIAKPQSFRVYRDWAIAVMDALRSQVDALHAAGLAHGDLHPGNVLVDNSQAVALIDLEMAVPAESINEASIGARGFVREGELLATERDLYALACTELHVFLPLTPLIELHPGKADELVQEAASLFDLSAPWVERISKALCRDPAGLAGPKYPRPQSVNTIATALARDATPRRDGRLWPGDPRQFSEPSLSLAHGALGVAVALQQASIEPAAESTAWIKRALRRRETIDRAGLMDGIAGAMWACRKLGIHTDADLLLEDLAAVRWDRAGSDLYSGAPGVGLALLAEAASEPQFVDTAVRILDMLDKRRSAVAAPEKVKARGGGLMGGATGTAVLAVRLHEATGDPSFLMSARAAIQFDLASLVKGEDGSLQVNEGWRVLPYLGFGAAGIGTVVVQYLNHVPNDEHLRSTLRGLVLAASTPFAVQSGLLNGRAGLIHFLLSVESSGFGSDRTTVALNHHLRQLSLHALPDGRFVGDGLLRASCDLATGSAGVLTALISAQRRNHFPEWIPIPYLNSPNSPPVWGGQ